MTRRRAREPLNLTWPDACQVCGRPMPVERFKTACSLTCRSVEQDLTAAADRRKRAIRKAGGLTAIDKLLVGPRR